MEICSSVSMGLRQGFEEERGQEEEEALSLCDLPVNVMKEEDEEEEKEEHQRQPLLTKSSYQHEEFQFGRCGSGPLSVTSEMCAADDVFYRGKILPLRHSFGSNYENLYPAIDKIPSCFQPVSLNCGQSVSRSKSMDHNLQALDSGCGISSYACLKPTGSNLGGQSLSRSGSMDRIPYSGFNSFSSSSSSSRRSIARTSSVSTGSDVANTRITNSKPKEVNQFRISHPSPKPQTMRQSNPGTQFSRNRNKSSSMWDFFKLGLVRTPELQDLNKVRGGGAGTVSRNSSSGSSSFSTGNSNYNSKAFKSDEGGSKGRIKQSGFFERRGGTMLSGCSCTVSAVVKPVPLNNTVIKSDEDPKKVTAKRKNKKHRTMVNKETTVEKLKQKEEGEGIGKQEMSRHRTFEWIKELSQSHASYIHDINNMEEEEEEKVVASTSS